MVYRELSVVDFVISIYRFDPFIRDSLFSEISITTHFSIWEKIMSIFVGNLSYEVTEEELSSVFKEYGSVTRVSIPTDRETGNGRGFAFVDMGSPTEETAAIEALDGAEWYGRSLKVNQARPKEDRGGNNKRPFGGGNRRTNRY
jgi:RNA recognition motif-containing protein